MSIQKQNENENQNKNEYKLHAKVYDRPFEVRDTTPINFGKLKTKPHTVLLDSENPKYVAWLLSTENEFAASTKVWLASKGIAV